jgi:hypothetical protein
MSNTTGSNALTLIQNRSITKTPPQRIDDDTMPTKNDNGSNDMTANDSTKIPIEEADYKNRIELSLQYLYAMSAGDKDEAPQTPGWYLEKMLRGEPFHFCKDCGEPVQVKAHPCEWGDDGCALIPPDTLCQECLIFAMGEKE